MHNLISTQQLDVHSTRSRAIFRTARCFVCKYPKQFLLIHVESRLSSATTQTQRVSAPIHPDDTDWPWDTGDHYAAPSESSAEHPEGFAAASEVLISRRVETGVFPVTTDSVHSTWLSHFTHLLPFPPPSAIRTYSIRNCQIECQTKAVYDRCQCIMYFMPQVYENATVCGSQHSKCLSRVPAKYLAGMVQSHICDCFPSCSEITYSASMSFAQLLEHSPKVRSTGLPRTELAVMHAYLPVRALRNYDRKEHVTVTDFVCKLTVLIIIILTIFVGWTQFCSYFVCVQRALAAYWVSVLD